MYNGFGTKSIETASVSFSIRPRFVHHVVFYCGLLVYDFKMMGYIRTLIKIDYMTKTKL